MSNARGAMVKAWSWFARRFVSERNFFDAEYYLSTNADVANAKVDPFDHFMQHGWREGRRPSKRFDTLYYMHAQNLTKDVNALTHFIENRWSYSSNLRPASEEENVAYQVSKVTPYIDQFFYRNYYHLTEDVDVVEHYLREGWKREFDPSPYFSTRDHLLRHPFVKHIGASPLYHRLTTYAEELGSVEIGKSSLDPTRSYAPLCSAIEHRSTTAVRGWVFDPDNPGMPVTFDVTLDSAPFARVTADRPRKDVSVLNANVSGGGFEILLPPGKGSVTLEIRWKGASLRGTPMEIELRPAPPVAFAVTPRAPIALVVPVYKAFEETRRCLRSILRHTTIPARLIVIDDASPDPAARELLGVYQNADNIDVYRNEQNLGYTRTVNRGISLAGECDVVLLNSDTEVGPRWLENMRHAAYSGERIASVTAVSDNAGAFTVPEINRQVPRPGECSIEDYQRLVLQHARGFLPEAPTGNGFCLYMRRDAINAVGVFDAEAFPRGYGEENDWSMRALRRGLRHLIDDRTLVHHVRSASFGAEKAKLVEQGRAVIDARYPEYGALIRRFETSAGLNGARHCVRRLHVDFEQGRIERPRPRALFVISTTTGGTPMTNRDLMRGVAGRFEPWLLHCDRYVVTLRKVGASVRDDVIVESEELAEPIEIIQYGNQHYTQIVRNWLLRYAFEIIHIRHLAWHGVDLPQIARALSIPTVLSFHDFYTVCPSVKLIDEEMKYCAGRCTESTGDCELDLWSISNLPPLKKKWVYEWRAKFAATFESCDAFVTTSHSAKAILEDAFPSLVGRRFEVIEHGRDFAAMHAPKRFAGVDSPVDILVPGNISPAKGRDLIAAIAAIDGGKRLRFHILGTVHPPLSGDGVITHGPYRRKEFASRSLATGARIGAVLSIWPETYCHTLTELWSVGFPVIGLDFGAVAERIRETGTGWIVEHHSAAALYEAICAITMDPEDIRRKQERVRAWQLEKGTNFTTAHMAARYKSLYARVMNEKRAFRPTAPALTDQQVSAEELTVRPYVRYCD